MANNAQRLVNQFVAFSGAGKRQSAFDSPMTDSDLDTRDRCEISVEDVVQRQTIFDCDGRDIDDETVNTRLKRFTFTYASVRPQILARWAAYFFGGIAAPTGTPADEVQTIQRTGTVTGGSFTLSLSLEGRTGTTAPIAWNASTAQIQAALTKVSSSIGRLIKDGDVAVSGDWTSGIVLTFAGRLAKANLPLLTADTANLTGTAPGLAVTQTTAAEQRYHAISRSTSDAKVYFSFALGFKTGSLATEKYYNAVCERFDPTLNRTGDVGLTVGVLCNYEPELIAAGGFAVPACTNYAPLKTSDCRVQIGADWKTLDIFSQTMSLSDNVPVDEDTFGFDGPDPDALERGDQPAYSISALLFAALQDTSDPVAVAVKNESKTAYVTHFGMPGDRFSLIAPNAKLKSQSNSRQFAGARNRSVVALDAVPHRDGANAPVRAESYISQDTAFLLT